MSARLSSDMHTPLDHTHPQPDIFGGSFSPTRASAERPSSYSPTAKRLTFGDVGTEGFVLIGMALVTLAVGSALHLHAGLSFTASLTCALITYLGVLMGHSFVHHRSAIRGGHGRHGVQHPGDNSCRTLSDDHDARGNGVLATPSRPSHMDRGLGANDSKGPPPVPSLQQMPLDAAASIGDLDIEVHTRSAVPTSMQNPPTKPATGRPSASAQIAPLIDDGPPPRPPREADVEMVEALIKKLADEVNGEAALAASKAETVTTAPTSSVLPNLVASAAASGEKKSKPVSIASMTSSASKSVTDTDVKRKGPVTIASQKAQARPLDSSGTNDKATREESAEGSGARANSVNDGATGPIDVSVAALRTTADAMRGGETAVTPPPENEKLAKRDDRMGRGETPSSGSAPLPPAIPNDATYSAQSYGAPDYQLDTSPENKPVARDDAMFDPAAFAIIGEALDAGRVDVLLDPILGLDNRRARHFEISLRLRDIDNSVIDTQDYCERLGGSGLSTILDRATFSRTATVAVQLEARGRNGAVFSKIAGESMCSDAFLNDVFEAFNHRASLSAQLVMTLTQEHVRMFGQGEWETLRDLRILGFRFALTSVTDLDMDFEDLSEKGFAFVKLDADVFLNGLLTGETRVPSRDICSHLAAYGQSVIVERIDDEGLMAKVAGFGVVYGQGQLFGGPRAVKANALKAGPGIAAA